MLQDLYHDDHIETVRLERQMFNVSNDKIAFLLFMRVTPSFFYANPRYVHAYDKLEPFSQTIY
jgi:hypothetical protein